MQLDKKNSRLFVAFAAFAMLFLLAVNQPITIHAQETKESHRLECQTDSIYLNQLEIVMVTVNDLMKGESLIVTSSDPAVVTVNLGKWYQNQARVVLTPKSEGSAKIYVTTQDMSETLTISVHSVSKEKMSATKLYEKCCKAMVELTTYDSIGQKNIGSGFFINEHQVLTNYHVIQEAGQIEIKDYNGNAYTVTSLAAYHESYDLAVLTVKETAPSALVLCKSKLLTGQTVYAIGSPIELTGSITKGIISYAYRKMDYINYVQHTASISKSSGGGPLLDEYGQVIGINCMYMTYGQNIYLAVHTSYLETLDWNHPIKIQDFYKKNEGKIKDIVITIPIGY